MKEMTLDRMEMIEGGIQVHPFFCGGTWYDRVMQLVPAVGGYCIGIAIGNLFYS